MRPDQIIIIALSSHWIFAANGFSLRTTNKNSLLQQNIIRPDASILCSSHRIHRQEGSTTGASSSATSLYSVNDETQQQQQKSRPLFVELTPQERILKEALGIEPETYEEKQKRQNEQRRKVEQIQIEKRKNIAVAILSFTLACVNYFYQFTHPITSLTLLTEMQKKSDDLTLIGNNGKPTVIDFWAPWCENCKSAAPTLAAIEDEYRNKVNFIMVNGDLGENWELIDRFGVDAIPHMAMVGSDGYVETALIGPIPKNVLKADLDVLIQNGISQNAGIGGNTNNQQQQQGKKLELPYTMYDAFRNRPDSRKISF